MRKRIPSSFGLATMTRLAERGMTQKDLMKMVEEKTDMFLDGGYLYKILTGQRKAPKITQAIKDILDLQDDYTETAVQ